jgi:hypothetical protein
MGYWFHGLRAFCEKVAFCNEINEIARIFGPTRHSDGVRGSDAGRTIQVLRHLAPAGQVMVGSLCNMNFAARELSKAIVFTPQLARAAPFV